ncbi:MAG: hypothetical protein V8R14_06465 [Clostridia bacterium]
MELDHSRMEYVDNIGNFYWDLAEVVAKGVHGAINEDSQRDHHAEQYQAVRFEIQRILAEHYGQKELRQAQKLLLDQTGMSSVFDQAKRW